MKTKLILSILFVCGIVFSLHQIKENRKIDLMFENVEALAASEGGESFCYSSGTIDCYGRLVLYRLNAR